MGVAYVQFQIAKDISHLPTKIVFKNTTIKHLSKILLTVIVISKLFSGRRDTNIAVILVFQSFIWTDGWTMVEDFEFGTLWNAGGALYIWFVSMRLLTPSKRLLFWAWSNFEKWSVCLTWSVKPVTSQSLSFSTLLIRNVHAAFSSSSV